MTIERDLYSPLFCTGNGVLVTGCNGFVLVVTFVFGSGLSSNQAWFEDGFFESMLYLKFKN